ncbi:unnamed protein product [Nippostrongylus brasiliensis]|uniref:EF-hand domain-containing protein n=1 Tax=Nippostrongylus brasiliensis TaxID=27835 RepID=A0A0N4YXF6_NIPBR|nr:unnamed protein product [Nippostrongylus brasiliensis]
MLLIALIFKNSKKWYTWYSYMTRRGVDSDDEEHEMEFFRLKVFKHYDHDRDGYISQAEFRQISGNFPFIDPFGAIDLDRRGSRSRTVSTISSSPSPEPTTQQGCSHVGEKSGCLNKLYLPSIRNNRPQSESVDCYKTHGISPDEDHGLASLACEEVFDDDSSGTCENGT